MRTVSGYSLYDVPLYNYNKATPQYLPVMNTILDFPTSKLTQRSQRQPQTVLKRRLFKLTSLPNNDTLLSIQNALEEARLNHDWRASRKKIECAIRQANFTIIHSNNKSFKRTEY